MDIREAMDIKQFYSGQRILLTGATGFLGKALIEKLIRSCPDVDHLYLLVRSKKGKDSQQRFNELFNDPVFARMKKEKPDFQKKVTLLAGDVSQPDIGLSNSDKEKIMSEVTIVFHGAATVRFDEQLKLAVGINIFGTQEILKLCQSCPNLKSVIHISTAYANCQIKEIEEKIYTPPIDGEKMIQLTNCLPDEIINKCTNEIITGWPNTYAFTKQIAEDIVRMYGKSLPIAVFRPAIVVGSHCEPVPGWIDNVYGPTGVIVGVGAGVMRTIHADKKIVADLVPVDLAVNAIIAAAWNVAQDGPQEEIPVYNYVSSEDNPLLWGQFLEYYLRHGKSVPSIKALWYYTLTITRHRFIYNILTFFLHLLPALIIDSILVATAQKPQALKIYQKIHKFSQVVSHFGNTQWKFHNERVNKLWLKLSKSDQKEFNFDITSVDWDKFAKNNVQGVRVYLFQDTPDTIPSARRKMMMLHVLHRIVQVCIVFLTVWFLWGPFLDLLLWSTKETHPAIHVSRTHSVYT